MSWRTQPFFSGTQKSSDSYEHWRHGSRSDPRGRRVSACEAAAIVRIWLPTNLRSLLRREASCVAEAEFDTRVRGPIPRDVRNRVFLLSNQYFVQRFSQPNDVCQPHEVRPHVAH